MAGGRRLAVFVVLAASEIIFATSVFDFQLALPPWRNPVLHAHTLGIVAVLAALLMVIVGWSRRLEFWGLYKSAPVATATRGLALNLTLFLALLIARHALSVHADAPGYLPALYAGLLIATASSLALIAAPLAFWLEFIRRARMEIVVAILGASLALVASRFAQESWSTLAAYTLSLSYWLLTLYEPSVQLIADKNVLAVAGFTVEISSPCSGYEGAGLIGVALSLYLWIFRRELRFPNALLLVPLGIVVLWVLNAVRIAALVSIGAHFSPAVALGGFHSQAGWIAFLFVTFSVIWLSRRLPFFAKVGGTDASVAAKPAASAGAEITLQYLAPFIALMAGSIVAAIFVPHDQWLYAVKVAAVTIAILAFRSAYRPLLSGASIYSVVVGAAIGVAWVLSDPGAGQETPLGIWLAGLSAPAAAIWLTLRALGSVVLVPIAEELAFRGFLHRALISIRFETVRFTQTSALALIGSSLAFGFMHQRWIEAAIAGAIYALLMVRSGRISDAVAAHMASNAVIMAWAVAAGQWSLL